MHWKRTLAIAGVMAVVASFSGTALAQSKSTGQEVFILSAAPLDEPRGLCLDIPGHRDRVDVGRNLVVHTCKRDVWNLDERFAAAAFDRGLLRMPAYDLCAVARGDRSGDAVRLVSCDGTAAQRWIFSETRLMPVANPDLCLTIGPGPSELTPGGRRLPSRHVARSMALAECSDGAVDRQSWKLEVPGG